MSRDCRRHHRRHRPFGVPSAWVPSAWITGLALTLSACAPGDDYAGPRFPFLGSYSAQRSGAPVLLSNAAWWQRFQDPALDHLVAEVLAANLSLATARERVIAARAQTATIPAQAIFSPRATVTGVTSSTAASNITGEASLGLNWMLDPYGARREQIKASLARAEAAEAEADAARLLVLFNLCNAYVDLRYRERLLTLRQQELVSRRRVLALAQTLFDANSGTRLELARAEAGLAEVQAQIPGLEAGIRVQRNEIAVLAGRLPGSDGPEGSASRGQPRAGLSPDVGIPADLLRNRPDIRIAERLYYAAIADIGVAKADLYPRLSLTGALSLNTVGRGGTGRETVFGPAVQFPALNPNAARAGVELRRSVARQAHTAWKATVLGAILEVENALLEYDGSRRAQSSAERSLRLYKEAQGLTRTLAETGDATLGDLIDAEQSVTQSANALAETLRQQGRNFIALNIRLGSGSADGAVPPDAVPVSAVPVSPAN